MSTRVGLIDTTLRDGNQSLWATRMTTEMMLPILPTLDEAGYDSIEIMAGVNMDVCVRYLGENPWEKVRSIRSQVSRTPLRMLGISMFLSISRVLPDDVIELFNHTCARAGIEQTWITAAMNDVRTAETSIRAARAAGCRTEGAIQYTISPVHTDEFFVDTAKQFMRLDIDALVLKDAGGLLTPERAATLVPALVAVAGDVPVYCHSHCVSGMGPAANLATVQHGAQAIWTASTPLANGPSMPSDEDMARDLMALGYEVDVDQTKLAEVAQYFRRLAHHTGKPTGSVAKYSAAHYIHQMPGGMQTNFEAQLQQFGLSEQLDEVLEEMPRVRQELGYPNMQTPFSQFVATQSLLNVLHGRYETVPDEIRKLVLGYWGRTPGPIDVEVMDKVAAGEEPVTERPGALVPPILDWVRREQGPFHTDEDLLMATLWMPEVLDELRRSQRAKASEAVFSMADASTLGDLVREAAAVRGAQRVHVSSR